MVYCNLDLRSGLSPRGGGGATPADTEPSALSTASGGFALGMFAVPGYANVSEPYAMLPAVKGGSGTKTFSLSGTLPAGCSFNTATGEITGTPTTVGSYGGLQITCTDSSGSTQSQVFTIPVGAAPTVINPSGDTTGVTDTAAINAALSAGQSVRMANGAGGSLWYLTKKDGTDIAAIVQPGNTALYLPDRQMLLAAGSNCQFWRNQNIASRTRTDKNMAVIGTGNLACIVNGNGANQVRQSNARFNQLFVGTSVENIMMKGFRGRGNMAVWHFIGVKLGVIRNAHPDQATYAGSVNLDGFDLGSGSSFIHVENMVKFSTAAGNVYDDAFSFYAKAAQSPTAMMAGTAWEAGADVSDIIINKAQVGLGLSNMFRLQAGDGFTLKRLFAKDCDNTLGGSNKVLIQFGESTFLNTRGQAEDMADIYITGSAKLFTRLINADSNFSNVTLKDLALNTNLAAVMSTPDTHTVKYHDITIDGLTEINAPRVHTTGFAAPRAGSTISNITLKNWTLSTFTTLFSSANAISGVVMDTITIATGTPTVTSSPVSSGTMHLVTAGGSAVSPGSSGLVTI